MHTITTGYSIWKFTSGGLWSVKNTAGGSWRLLCYCGVAIKKVRYHHTNEKSLQAGQKSWVQTPI